MRIFIPLLLMFITASSYADVGNDLNNFFHSLGFTSNVSKPRAFQDQKGGYFSGGSLIMRNNAENATLFEVMPPSLSFGCGAIDLFGGAFTFINKEQFLGLMNNIGKNAISFGISIAMQTAAPQIKSVIDQLMGYMQDVNGMNMNACNLTANALGGALPKSKATSDVLCESIGIAKNKFSDYAAAKQGCGPDGKSGEINSDKANHQEFADMLGEEYNLAWKALNKSALFSGDPRLAELFMSISGSVVMQKPKNQENPQKAKAILKPLESLAKNDGLLAALVTGGKATVYQCDKTGIDECLNPAPKEITITENKAFAHYVHTHISNLSQKVLTDSAISAEEKAFVNSTYFPVLKIIAVENAFKAGHAPISANELAEIIAYDIVLRYLSRIIELTAIAVTKLQSIQLASQPFKDFAENITQVRQLIYQKRHGLFYQLNTTLAVVERTSQIEKQLHDMFMHEEII